jgi:predicted Zn finger-like uncharacterized protein
MSTATPEKMTIACPHCAAQFKVAVSLAGKKGRCAKCQGILPIPYPAEMPLEAEVVEATVVPGPGNEFDDAFGDYQLMNEPPPAMHALPQTPVGQYQMYAPGTQAAAPAKDYSGAFGMEKKALDGGLLVGIGVTILGCLWLFGGLAADRFFPYSIVVILIGVVGTIKGFIGLFK